MKNPGLNILLVEDQTAIAQNIADYLESKNHKLDFAVTGEAGVELSLSRFYDLVVLDILLPGKSGWKVCEEIRLRATRHIPILMLTARDSVQDKVKGFALGADDYLTKPFSLEELEVRCIALSRRHLLQTSHLLTVGNLVIDRRNQCVTREGREIPLSQIGYQILLVLAEAFPRVVTRSELYQRIWGEEFTESDSLRSHIYQLRQVLDKPFASEMLKTVHGIGFSLVIQK